MEVTEGNVRVAPRPEVTIGDYELVELIKQGDRGIKVIEKEIMALVTKVNVQRDMLMSLEKELRDARDRSE